MSDAKLKHLELIQAIVARQARNSFQAKTWAIALLAGLAGLSRGTKSQILITAAGVVIVFWLLDSYYLSKERVFRNFYERSAAAQAGSLSLIPDDADRSELTRWWRCSMALVEMMPYGAMALGILIVGLGA